MLVSLNCFHQVASGSSSDNHLLFAGQRTKFGGGGEKLFRTCHEQVLELKLTNNSISDSKKGQETPLSCQLRTVAPRSGVANGDAS